MTTVSNLSPALIAACACSDVSQLGGEIIWHQHDALICLIEHRMPELLKGRKIRGVFPRLDADLDSHARITGAIPGQPTIVWRVLLDDESSIDFAQTFEFSLPKIAATNPLTPTVPTIEA